MTMLETTNFTLKESEERLGDGILSPQEFQACKTIVDSLKMGKKSNRTEVMNHITEYFVVGEEKTNKIESRDMLDKQEAFYSAMIYDIALQYFINGTTNTQEQDKQLLDLSLAVLKLKNPDHYNNPSTLYEQKNKKDIHRQLENDLKSEFSKTSEYKAHLSTTEELPVGTTAEQFDKYQKDLESKGKVYTHKQETYTETKDTVVQKDLGTSKLTFIETETDPEDERTKKFIDNNILAIQTQLNAIKNNPNTVPGSEKIMVSGSASHLPHPDNEGLARKRAEWAKNYIVTSYPEYANLVEVKSGINGPAYDATTFKEEQRPVYREYQNVGITVTYQEKQKVPVEKTKYSIERKSDGSSILEGVNKWSTAELIIQNPYRDNTKKAYEDTTITIDNQKYKVPNSQYLLLQLSNEHQLPKPRNWSPISPETHKTKLESVGKNIKNNSMKKNEGENVSKTPIFTIAGEDEFKKMTATFILNTDLTDKAVNAYIKKMGEKL